MATNSTNRRHGWLAVAGQLAICAPFLLASVLTARPLFVVAGLILGHAITVAFFVGREHSQRERAIEKATRRTVFELQWWEGFTNWTHDAKMDVIHPYFYTLVVAVVGSAAALTRAWT